MEKKEIRKDIKAKRDALDALFWNKNSNVIQKNIIKSEAYKNADIIMCYCDFQGEVGTLIIIEDALMKGKKLYLPKCEENFVESRMDFYEVVSTIELIEGYKGIKEPTGNKAKAFDYENNKNKKILMLVPGVAFTKAGYRVGYGKGYYDKYLSDKENILKVGLCFSMQLVEEINVNEFDIKMDFLVTEKTLMSEINGLKF